jgi:hypothetical protein
MKNESEYKIQFTKDLKTKTEKIQVEIIKSMQ